MGKVNSNRSEKKEVCGGSGAAQLTGKKRKNEGTLLANKDVNAKRSKKVVKKVCSQRLEYEEISVLQGILDCYALTGKNPFVNMKETFEFMKEYTNLESFDEFVEKMNSLKKQLMDQRRNAKEPSTSDCYYQKVSKLLTSAVEKPKRSKRAVKPKEEKQTVMSREGEKWFENASLVRQVVSRGVDEDSLKSKWDARGSYSEEE
ncbi:PREDICTED: probable transcription factor At4g00232 [Camelina sativa]|uniref:Probable transcription factor At4g00232 n=1 Tax=Camelina sativa TaxID=90675 RepID=A0ABM0XSM5_CAMSA|nr:PREDICTED: probable transcription factor At4g00232 [Camelina sativa]